MFKSVARATLERELAAIASTVTPGVVLDVGARDGRYRSLIPHTKWIAQDASPNPGLDFIGDAHELTAESGSIDTILATEVLEHLYDPQRAVEGFREALRAGGMCIASTRFVHPYHPDPRDYYRFTADGLRHLFRNFARVEVRALGNRFHATWTLAVSRPGLGPLTMLTPLLLRLPTGRTDNPCGWLVVAWK